MVTPISLRNARGFGAKFSEFFGQKFNELIDQRPVVGGRFEIDDAFEEVNAFRGAWSQVGGAGRSLVFGLLSVDGLRL